MGLEKQVEEMDRKRGQWTRKGGIEGMGRKGEKGTSYRGIERKRQGDYRGKKRNGKGNCFIRFRRVDILYSK